MGTLTQEEYKSSREKSLARRSPWALTGGGKDQAADVIPPCWRNFIMEVLMRDYDGSDNLALVASAGLLTRNKRATFLGSHIAADASCAWHCVDLLDALASENNNRREKRRQ